MRTILYILLVLAVQAALNIYYATELLDLANGFRFARVGGITREMMARCFDILANFAFYNGAAIIIIIGLVIGEIITMMRRGQKTREMQQV